MKPKAAKIVFGIWILLFVFLTPNLLRAQMAATTLSGTITDSSGKTVPDANISINNVETGQSTQAQTNATGVYTVPDLSPGNYAVSVSAKGFAAKTRNVTVTGSAGNTANLVLQTIQSQPELPSAP
ncbi:MAG: carboxypeptidase-like regulatory domain-containing protein, partial [Candidatus Micrarchaeaceae archaeon]